MIRTLRFPFSPNKITGLKDDIVAGNKLVLLTTVNEVVILGEEKDAAD